MQLPLESVPNFSEGRDQATIDAIAAALGAPVRLLDIHADADHNRSVFTVVGAENELLDALVAAVACARERIDLRAHEGAHPRIGVADVVPVVPIRPSDMPRARATALELARRLGDDGTPVFLYGESGEGQGPAFFRKGGLEALRRRVAGGELAPDYGPHEIDERTGAAIVGARRPLIAFNVDLRNASIDVARDIAGAIREGGGGFPGVRALGLELPRAGRVQVSMNVEDWEAALLHEIVARIAFEAARHGAELGGSELVGLMPAGAAAAAAGHVLGIEGFDTRYVLELRLLDDGPD